MYWANVLRGITLFVVISVILIGCTATSWLLDDTIPLGQDFDLNVAKQIQDGITTKAEIEKTFGQPDGITVTGGTESWGYVYKRVAPGRQKTWGVGTSRPHTTRSETTVRYEKKLVVTFDDKSVVVYHQVSESGRR